MTAIAIMAAVCVYYSTKLRIMNSYIQFVVTLGLTLLKCHARCWPHPWLKRNR